MKKMEFPKGFYWGAATSSHQVEGGNKNDWTEWESENAHRLANEAGKRWQKWQQEKFPEMFNQYNYMSRHACNHYARFEEDFDIAKELGHNAHRFSIEWSRIEPEEGKFNEEEIEHYRKVIQALKARGIEPFVTLWHWTLPIWFRDKGGWKCHKSTHYFKRYVEKIVLSLGSEVRYWITLNEPNIYTAFSYVRGAWPPQERGVMNYPRINRSLVRAHKEAFKVIKKQTPESKVGIAQNFIYYEAAGNSILNRILKTAADYFWNFCFLNKIRNHQDFIGVNYYHRDRINYGFHKNDNKELTDFGWEIYPEGIFYVLLSLKKYNVPLYITENGIADVIDEKRADFINSHLREVARAITEGVDVRGYFYWSLLDNFEWSSGFWPRFGLVKVNFETTEREIRPSAQAYATICRDNAIEA